MPNWCECLLNITSNNYDDLDKFYIENRDTNEDMELSFNKSVPLPPEEEENWYNWHIANWGTKWDLSSDTYFNSLMEEKELEYQFNTAWGPPINWLATVSEMYPLLTFSLKYAESGCNFAGLLKIKDGEEISHDEYSYYYYQWIENKDDILNDIYSVGKEMVKEKINQDIESQKNLIKLMFDGNYFLPDELQDIILKYNIRDIEIKAIKDLIENNPDNLKELMEEDYNIFDTDILTDYVYQELK